MSFWQNLARATGVAASRPRGAPGTRVYAVGDIHGRLVLLDRLLAKVAIDARRDPARRTVVVFLGDLVDRGPDSKGVLERLRLLRDPVFDVRFLMGNHEELFLRALDGEPDVLESWLQFGGDECLRSYAVAPDALFGRDPAEVATLLRRHVPVSHIDFLRSFTDTLSCGDYLFVHAGIRPGVRLENQVAHDLRWIREPFLSDRHEHEFIVVHGHTITDVPEVHPNRIAIDTGAYRSGVLTSVMIEHENVSFIQAGAKQPASGLATAALTR